MKNQTICTLTTTPLRLAAFIAALLILACATIWRTPTIPAETAPAGTSFSQEIRSRHFVLVDAYGNSTAELTFTKNKASLWFYRDGHVAALYNMDGMALYDDNGSPRAFLSFMDDEPNIAFFNRDGSPMR